MRSIKLLSPSASSLEIAAVSRVLKSTWWGLGPVTQELEERFASFVGVEYAIGVNSCTSALHLALHELPKRGEIIVPALTFASTALVGLYEQQKIVFADIDETTYCLDPADVEKRITKKTTAVIPVHYAGRLADIPYKKEVKIIEDCAHAAGTPGAGHAGGISAWSFHPVKNIATADAGMVTTNDRHLYERLKKLRWFGISASTWERGKKGYHWEYEIDEIGYKYHTNDILSAIALEQLKRIKALNAKRKKIAELYTVSLSKLPLILPPESGNWHLYVIRVDKKMRNRLIDYLRSKGIATGVHYKPLYYYKIFNYSLSQAQKELPNTHKVWQEIISLPIYPDLSESDQNFVIKSIQKFFR